MENYYELFSLDRAQNTEKIREQLLAEKKKQINRQNNAPTNDKRYEAEKLLEKIAEAEEIFSDDAKRKEYDKTLKHGNAEGRPREQKVSGGSGEERRAGSTFNPNAKPTRKLYDGIDYDNGSFFKTEYGRYTVISYDDAFEEINDTMCKMLTLGPTKGQSHQSFYNEFLRIARLANTDRSKIDTDVLANSIFKCMDTLFAGTDGSVGNILAQNIFYYLSELYDNRKYCYDPAYIVCSLRDTLFCYYLQDIDYYRQIVKAFYMALKGDKSMPQGLYDLSYVTAENEKYLDIYYLELADYYTKKAIDFAEQGYEISYLDTYRKTHELYCKFRKSIETYLNGSKKEKKEEKKLLIEVYNEALAFTSDHDDKSDFFVVKQPYNVGLAYAISRVLKDKGKANAAIKKLSFGKDILSGSNRWMSPETNGPVNNVRVKTPMYKWEVVLSVISVIAFGAIVFFSFTKTMEFFKTGIYYETDGLLKYWGCIIAFFAVVVISRGEKRLHRILTITGMLYFIVPRIYQMYVCLITASLFTFIVYFFITCLIVGVVIKAYF